MTGIAVYESGGWGDNTGVPTVYGLTCPVTERIVYVGQTHMGLAARVEGHASSAREVMKAIMATPSRMPIVFSDHWSGLAIFEIWKALVLATGRLRAVALYTGEAPKLVEDYRGKRVPDWRNRPDLGPIERAEIARAESDGPLFNTKLCRNRAESLPDQFRWMYGVRGLGRYCYTWSDDATRARYGLPDNHGLMQWLSGGGRRYDCLGLTRSPKAYRVLMDASEGVPNE